MLSTTTRHALVRLPHVESPFSTASKPARWWAEPHLFLLIGIVAVAYCLRLGDLTLRGEETRWAQSAREMLWTGDWIVPRQQGEPFVYRPPLGSWLMAVTTLVRGECDLVAVRLPSILATLFTALLIYAYSRQFLSSIGAFSAGLAYATMGQVIELGRLGETDSLFTLLVSGSLFGWHMLYRRYGAVALTWMAGYGLAALATLAKGPQAPVYFLGPVGLYLLWIGDWRGLLRPGQWLGLLSYCMILGAWEAGVAFETGWVGIRQMWWSETAQRFLQHTPKTIAWHLLSYPGEVMLCTAPWSLALLGFAFRRVRRSLPDETRSSLTFLVICLFVTFPTCWLPPGGRGRYFMPLYPCLAVMVGMILQSLTRMEEIHGWRRWFLGKRAARWCLGLALSVIAVYLGPVVSMMANKSEDIEGAVARLKAGLPAEARLISFERVHHHVAYHYGTPIELRPFPMDKTNLDDGMTFFCFDRYGRPGENLPFAWEEVAVISCDRNHKVTPETVVVVGRVQPDEKKNPASR